MHHEYEFKQKPNIPLFADAGMIPGGECWMVPTDAFLKLWESPAQAVAGDCGTVSVRADRGAAEVAIYTGVSFLTCRALHEREIRLHHKTHRTTK